jgi:hypothetical protein
LNQGFQSLVFYCDLDLFLGTLVRNTWTWLLGVKVKNEGLVDDEIQITIKIDDELLHDNSYKVQSIKID